ncbi:MAG: TIM44-like domain-containing protein [Alphaproteobacteria bacterium]|nr:TIM44-like domain-containing protein [Alphaproteobacteria bacterium]
MRLFRSFLSVLAVLAVFAMVAGDADARPRISAGSRGTRTYSAPAPTATAPNAANPINRSMTQPGQGGINTARPTTQPGGLFGGFGRGLAGGLLGGLLGAGLFGMLFGGGFFSGIAGFASILGLLLQVGLIVMVGMLLYRWWQRRSQPQAAYAGMAGGMGATNAPRSMLGGLGLGGNAAPASEPLQIARDDFDTFERMLGEIQTAYGREDLASLRTRVTPEMLSYYAEELSENASRGVVNQISDVKLLQGDLSEAWREGDKEYATVALRYSLIDRYVERATGRAADGTEAPQEATEVWTFTRVRGGTWLLSAIQQT